jgi:hypothetical protein
MREVISCVAILLQVGCVTLSAQNIAMAQSVATAAPAKTEALKAEAGKKRPATFNTMPMALYQALDSDQSTDSVALLIKQNLLSLSRRCEQVMAYQIFRYNSGKRTLKIKCSRQLLMAMTVDRTGGIQLIGGDGSIGDMLASDGRIYSIMGQTLKTYMAEQKVRDDATNNARATPLLPQPTPAAAPRWPIPMMALNLLLGVAALLVLRWLLFARRRGLDQDWAISSTDKDYMMDESREIYPNIFKHPRGFFISKGKRGKRRLFKYTFAAMLYRDLGLKIGEIGD